MRKVLAYMETEIVVAGGFDVNMVVLLVVFVYL